MIGIPVELLPIDQTAARLAEQSFRLEFEGPVCAVCNSSKWRNYPFCRDCSIKLQRAHLMRELRHWLDLWAETTNTEVKARRLAIASLQYDFCRAYLIDLRRCA